MNKKIIAAVLVVLILVAGGVTWWAIASDNDADDDSTSEDLISDVSFDNSVDLGDTTSACQAFTPEVAEQVLGPGATQVELTGSVADSIAGSSEDVAVTECLYEAAGGAVDSRSANIVVYGAKTQIGVDSNVFSFSDTASQGLDGEAAPTQPLSIGSEAYWNPTFGQVNVLVDNGQYWLVAQVTDGATNFDQAGSEQLAQLITQQLQ